MTEERTGDRLAVYTARDDLIFLRSRSSATHFIRCTDQEGQEVYVRVSDIVSARYRRCDE